MKLKKNKRFSYTPRFYKSDGDGSPYEVKHRFDEHRTSVGDNKGLKQKATSAFDELRNSPDKAVNRRVLIISLIIAFLILWFFDFDLTIFFKRQ